MIIFEDILGTVYNELAFNSVIESQPTYHSSKIILVWLNPVIKHHIKLDNALEAR